MTEHNKIAILAGGCFWGMEDLFRGLPGAVVTEVKPAGEFWEAEPEHQNYLQRYPSGYTCHYIRPEWILPNHGAGAGAATA